MTTPRRRLVRAVTAPTAPSPTQQRRLQKARARLEQERSALARWMKRLRRAFRAMEKCQGRVTRLERTIAQLEE